jgi:hypothetical protein
MTRERWDGRWALFALVLTLALSASAAAHAQTPPAQTPPAQTASDEAVWTTVSMRGQLTEAGSWAWSADTLVRSRDGVNTLDFLFQRVMVTGGVGEHATAGIAYAFGAGFLETGTLFEHRIAQQLTWASGRRTRVSLRNLLEERFISGRTSVLLRAREQVKVAWPLASRGRLAAIVSDEVLVQADARRVSTPVLDGNRLFVGVGRRLTPRSAMEVGYLNALVRSGSHGYRRSHVLSASLAATLQRRPR